MRKSPADMIGLKPYKSPELKRHEAIERMKRNGIEAYWDQLLQDTTSEYTVIPTPLEDEVDFELGLHHSDNFNQNHQNDFLKIFLDGTDQPKAYIYDIQPSEGIDFKINDKIFRITRPQLLPLPQHIEQIGFFHPTHQSYFLDLTPKLEMAPGFSRQIKKLE